MENFLCFVLWVIGGTMVGFSFPSLSVSLSLCGYWNRVVPNKLISSPNIIQRWKNHNGILFAQNLQVTNTNFKKVFLLHMQKLEIWINKLNIVCCLFSTVSELLPILVKISWPRAALVAQSVRKWKTGLNEYGCFCWTCP